MSQRSASVTWRGLRVPNVGGEGAEDLPAGPKRHRSKKPTDSRSTSPQARRRLDYISVFHRPTPKDTIGLYLANDDCQAYPLQWGPDGT